MVNATSTTPGLLLPTTKAMPAGNPRDSALAVQTQNNALQAKANSMAGGKKYGGAAAGVPVPQMQMPYKPTSGAGTDPNAQIASGSQTSTQAVANSKYDSKMGGYKRRKRRHTSKYGGNPNWNWPCSSSGKSKRKNKKSRKNRKSRRH